MFLNNEVVVVTRVNGKSGITESPDIGSISTPYSVGDHTCCNTGNLGTGSASPPPLGTSGNQAGLVPVTNNNSQTSAPTTITNPQAVTVLRDTKDPFASTSQNQNAANTTAKANANAAPVAPPSYAGNLGGAGGTNGVGTQLAANNEEGVPPDQAQQQAQAQTASDMGWALAAPPVAAAVAAGCVATGTCSTVGNVGSVIVKDPLIVIDATRAILGAAEYSVDVATKFIEKEAAPIIEDMPDKIEKIFGKPPPSSGQGAKQPG